MSEDIIRLTAGDFDELIAFLNRVFSEHGPHDFATLLPSIYQPTDEAMRCNYAIREGGRLGAVVGVFPIDWRVGGVPLKVAGVGGVSVHPDSRGKGYMKKLMCHAVDEMRREGYDLSYLGGRRQRYAYFGYEVAGTTYDLLYIPDNIRHTFKDQATSLHFEPVTDDPNTINQLKSLHDTQHQFCHRPPQRFAHFLKSWQCAPSLARDVTGRIVGYVVRHNEHPRINEFVAQDPAAAAGMIHRLFQDRCEPMSVNLYPAPGPILRRLNTFTEITHLHPGGNWQVFNWPCVLDTLIKSTHAAGPLPDGQVLLAIEGEPQPFQLRVDGDQASCQVTDQTPDLSLNPLKALQTLFGPGSPSMVIELPKHASILNAWCPLSLGISEQDHV